MVLFLLSSCSFLDNQPEELYYYAFPSTWQGYYQLKSTDDTLSYLTEEFKVSSDYMTFKNLDSPSVDEEQFTSYQIEYIYSKSTDSLFCFTVYPAYESQDFIEGFFTFVPSTTADNEVIVTYYYNTSGNIGESATYKKSDKPF